MHAADLVANSACLVSSKAFLRCYPLWRLPASAYQMVRFIGSTWRLPHVRSKKMVSCDRRGRIPVADLAVSAQSEVAA